MSSIVEKAKWRFYSKEDLIKQAQIKRTAASIPLLGIGGTYSGKTKGVVSIYLQSIHDSNSKCKIKTYILPKLTKKLPPYKTDKRSWSHTNGLSLADPKFYNPGIINIIIGADNFGLIIRDGLIQGDITEPVAQSTIFGWILSGPTSMNNTSQHINQAYHCSEDHDLKELLTLFWKQEEINSSSTSQRTPEEEECERHFLSTYTRDRTGRYVVKLPLKIDPKVLGESKSRAICCLNRLSRRFQNDTKIYKLYSEFLTEYINLGHMMLVKESQENVLPVYYLPHHGVLREDRKTTKLRVVFNGSSKTRSNYSLNDILHSGPKLQNEIIRILLWIRTHKVLFGTDIEKMFRQINLNIEDWNLQRILWKDTSEQIKIYNLTTVTYGLNCAPFLALRTLQQLVKDEGHHYPLAIDPMTKGRYVDDIFGGAETINEAKSIIDHVIKLCNAGKFPLKKWCSNFPEVLPYDKEKTSSVKETEPTENKILGFLWDPNNDTFSFSVKPHNSTEYTKRRIASNIARLYDPLGISAPIIIRAKLILQELWCLKTGWDEIIPRNIQEKWNIFRQQLLELNKLKVPRWLNHIRNNSTHELHGFSDASQQAIAAVVYIRTCDNDGTISSQLICSKTKVAPIKRHSIPRLELMAALLLVRLMKATFEALDVPAMPHYCWSDSSVTLAWINSTPSRWKEFVRNRVAIIQETLPNSLWKFVKGKENPADIATRGISAKKLQQCDLWWNGPNWLEKSQESWPIATRQPPDNVKLEERPGRVMLATTSPISYWSILDKYSSINKLLRVISICKRFINRLRKLPDCLPISSPITPVEIQQSCNILIGIIQRSYFHSEIQSILKGERLSKSNELIKLTPFLDQDGLLRVGGRLQNAHLNLDTTHPLILPKKSPLTTLIIDESHLKILHGGTQLTLGYIRSKYWILGGRNPVRSHILKCVRCARYRASRAQQLMGQLPMERVTPSRCHILRRLGEVLLTRVKASPPAKIFQNHIIKNNSTTLTTPAFIDFTTYSTVTTCHYL
ncbi:uncharacterized protein [Cardiocondyla obscurior]|uniref:uncharacterized protein n=1 Tax=Cardiocondyla obscurior TaxID=286306 RepID=UPI0039657A18